MCLKVASDIGNDATKMIIDGAFLKQPSVIKQQLTAPNIVEEDLDRNVANLMDELIVNITSPALKMNGMYLVGKRANLTSGQDNMNINLGEKHKHDIPVIMTLSMIAAHLIRNYYKEKGSLPSVIHRQLANTTAIPASEYTTDKAKFLESRFLNGHHVVIVYIGKSLVTVNLKFDKAKVTQEGVPALYALVDSDKGILDYYKDLYKKDIDPKQFAKKKILHVDIGDGTTEYIYTVGMNPVNDACTGERRGVGHATKEALTLMSERLHGKLNMNRQQFMDVVKDPEHRLHEEAIKCMDIARKMQAKRILEDVQEKYIEKTAGNADLIAVYGGGSIQFKSDLYEELITFAEDVMCEVLWIPEEYAVNMNVKGMDVLNKKVLYKG